MRDAGEGIFVDEKTEGKLNGGAPKTEPKPCGKIETIASITTRPEEKEQKAEEGGYLAAGRDLLEQGSKIAVDEL